MKDVLETLEGWNAEGLRFATATVKRWRMSAWKIRNRSVIETGTVVCWTGTVGVRSSPWPASLGLPGVPGLHWTKFSEIRPSGWIVQVAGQVRPIGEQVGAG